MTRYEKIRALVMFEIQWAMDNGTAADVAHITDYVMSLTDTFTDKGIDKIYKLKFEEVTE
jgi:hypothetical protein